MSSQDLPVPLVEYLIKQEYITSQSIPTEQLHSQILTILKTQSEDIARLRSQNLQYKKSLRQLQQKISLQSCNSNNTESKFMLSSEFKTKFQQFMKESVSLLIGSLLDDPYRYYEAFTSLVKNYYVEVECSLKQIMSSLAKTLKIEGDERQLFKNILKIIQDNHTKIFQPKSNQYYISFNKSYPEIAIEEDQFKRIFEEYHGLVVYMLLQEEKWEIVFGQQRELQYNKKQFTCIDGWIKQKEKSLVLIQGLKKSTGMHPNIKNYVIPIPRGYTKPTLILSAPNLLQQPISFPIQKQKIKTVQQNKIVLNTIEAQQQQKRIKTVEGPIKSLLENHFQISMQLQKKTRKASTSNLPVKVGVGKIVKQSSKLSTQRRPEVEMSRGKVEKKSDRQKQNQCLNVHPSKITNYKEIIKKKFIKEDNRSLMRSRDKLMCLYDSSMPSKTERGAKQREGSSQKRKKKEQNRPLKPTEEHIAKFRAKHKLL